MGEGSAEPRPTFCITVDGAIVGWVDFDRDERSWLTHDDVNVGYALHPDARGKGYASRAVMLLVHHLAQATDARTATLAIDFANEWSLGVARRCGFVEHGTITGDKEARFFRKPVPPLTYTDGTVTIRRPREEDAEASIVATDAEQIRWLFEPEHGPLWAAKSPAEKLEHQRAHYRRVAASFGSGPTWFFTIEAAGEYAGHVDVNLANPSAPHGEANVSYSCTPAMRGRGHVAAAVRLALQFLREHTGARDAHISVNPANVASVRVARAVGATEVERYVDHHGDTMIRHTIALDPR